jgi:hypothetical protein
MDSGAWQRTSRTARWSSAVAYAALFAVVLAGAPAMAQPAPRVGDLLPKLAAASDSRVRAATVLQLGATNDDAAVDPLCKELSDSAEVVRIAAASALRRLGRASAVGCLKSRLGAESSDAAKLQMSRAVQALEAAPSAPASNGGGGGGGSYEPPQHANAKYYVALSSVSSAGDRPQAEVEAVVLKAVRSKLEANSDIQLAPMKESSDAAKKAISQRKAKGFYLSISVEKPDYSGGNLRVKVNIAISSYPAKSLIAPSSKSATMAGVAPGSRSSEDQLLEAVASAAAKQFADNAHAM